MPASNAFQVDVDGVAGVQARLAAIQEAMEEIAEGAVERWTKEGAKIAAKRAPVDTGALQDSIRPLVEDMVGKIIAGEGLPDIRAVAQEFGTYKMQGQPYLRPTLEQISEPLFRDIQTRLRAAL